MEKSDSKLINRAFILSGAEYGYYGFDIANTLVFGPRRFRNTNLRICGLTAK
jgi:hypothetical protein